MAQVTNQNWSLSNADRIDPNAPGIAWNEAAEFSQQRLQVIERIKQILQSDEGKFISQERQFLDDTLGFLGSFWRECEEFVRAEEENLQRLQKEIATCRPEQEKNDAVLNDLRSDLTAIEKRIEEATNELVNVATKRKEIVGSINPAELSTIKFKDNLDTSNDVFKWAIEAIYGESKSSYYWENFKKAAFKKDKGVDFLARLRGLSTTKLKRDNFIFGKDVHSRSEAIIAELEPKKKQNASLRAFFDFIGNVVAAGDLQDKIEAEKVQLETRQNDIALNETKASKNTHILRSLEDKVKVSTHYVETLRKLKPLFDNAQAITQERIRFQEQYHQTLQGNTDAINTLVQSTSQLGQSPAKANQEQVFNTEQEQTETGAYAEQKEIQYETLREGQDIQVAQGEGEQIGGEEKFTSNAGKKVERQVPTTDLKESEFADPKKGGCETCSIF